MQRDIERAADQEIEQRRAEFDRYQQQRQTLQPTDSERKPLLGDESNSPRPIRSQIILKPARLNRDGEQALT